MELKPEWKKEAYKIMNGYQKEQGEQEYYMYYDVDVPKMIEKTLQSYANAVEALLKGRIETLTRHIELTDNSTLKAQYLTTANEISKLLFELEYLTPTTNE